MKELPKLHYDKNGMIDLKNPLEDFIHYCRPETYEEYDYDLFNEKLLKTINFIISTKEL